MSVDERVSELIKRIYSASHDQESWDAIAVDLLAMTGGCFGMSTVVDLSSREFNSYRCYGPETSSIARGVSEYRDTYKEDPGLIWASLNPRARFCDSRQGVHGEYLAHPFIQWNAARFGASHWYVGYTPPSQELSFSFSIHPPKEQGPMDEETARFFRMVFDHMECCVRLSRRPFKEHSARALLLLDRKAKVRQLSNGAQHLLSKPGALSVVDKQLVAASLAEQRKIDRGLAHALEVLGHGEAPSAIRVENPHGSPWIVVIRPILNSYGPFGNIEAELQVEIHAGLPRIGDLKLLQSLFNLTGREVQIVRGLADGHSVESMSESMAISANTARTHLRSIFAKTDTTRQSELLQLAGGLSSRDR